MDPTNPYESPSIDSGPPPGPTLSAANPLTVKMVRDFHVQIRALGFAWIVMGIIAMTIAVVVGLSTNPEQGTLIVLAVLGGVGLGWLVTGILACLRKIGAVYVGLSLVYLMLVPSFCFSIWLLLGLIAVILQAHRVIAWSWNMKRMGIPLSASPGELPAQRRVIDVSQWQ